MREREERRGSGIYNAVVRPFRPLLQVVHALSYGCICGEPLEQMNRFEMAIAVLLGEVKEEKRRVRSREYHIIEFVSFQLSNHHHYSPSMSQSNDWLSTARCFSTYS